MKNVTVISIIDPCQGTISNNIEKTVETQDQWKDEDWSDYNNDGFFFFFVCLQR